MTLDRRATLATIAVSEPDFKNKRRDIDISLLVLLKEIRWAEKFNYYYSGGTGFPQGLRNAVYFTFRQSASQDLCIRPTLAEIRRVETLNRTDIPQSPHFY